MAHNQNSVQQHKFTIVLLGQKDHLEEVMDRFSDSDQITPVPSDCMVAENSTVRVVSAPDILDTNNKYMDQHIIDCMALTLPGPHVFVLVTDSNNTEKQVLQINKTFGDRSKNVIIMCPDIEDLQSLNQLKEQSKRALITNERNLSTERFKYSFNNYSEVVVKRRQRTLSGLREDDPPVCDGAASCPSSYTSAPNRESNTDRTPFNIILLGLTGTGKSASANTILKAAKSKTSFTSISNSEPITLKCQIETVELYGSQITVVDTPDFFHENIKNSQEQLDVCKTFMGDAYVVLLVVKVNRFTDEERDILEKLEHKLETRIRENTFLLLTCGEELEAKAKALQFINGNPELQKVAEQCAYRFHVFKNNRNKPKQVHDLMMKLPYVQKEQKEKKWYGVSLL